MTNLYWYMGYDYSLSIGGGGPISVHEVLEKQKHFKTDGLLNKDLRVVYDNYQKYISPGDGQQLVFYRLDYNDVIHEIVSYRDVTRRLKLEQI